MVSRERNLTGGSVRRQGFTLLELAIVLAIISFIITISVAAGSSMIAQQRYDTTYQRMALIMKAADVYARVNGHLPCPADPTLGIDDPNFGDGIGTGGGTSSTGSARCNAANIQPAASADVTTNAHGMRGAVPVKQLGLAPLAAIDGWDRKFSYAVSEIYTLPGSQALGKPGFSNPDTIGNIQIVTPNFCGDYWNFPGTSHRVTKDAALFVFSHGPTGWGAYVRDGSGMIPDTAPRAESPFSARNAGGVLTNSADWFNQRFTAPGWYNTQFSASSGDLFLATAWSGPGRPGGYNSCGEDYSNERIMDYRVRWQLGQPL